MKIIRDKKTLTVLSKIFGFIFDSKNFYVVDSGNLEFNGNIETVEKHIEAKKQFNEQGYELKYFDGCFYPFIVEK
jgi:hypothetical protein